MLVVLAAKTYRFLDSFWLAVNEFGDVVSDVKCPVA